MSNMELCGSDEDSSEGSFVASTPLPASAAAAVDALASTYPSGSFVYPEEHFVEGVKISGSASLGKRPVSRALFDDENRCLDEELRLIGEIQHEEKVTSVTITGEACDKVLRLKEPLMHMYKQSVILTRVQLSEANIEGLFIVDTQGQVLGFCGPSSSIV